MKRERSSLVERLLKNVQEIHIKIKFCAPLPAEENIAFQLREITENCSSTAGSTDNGKPMLTVMLSDNLVAGGLCW